VEPKPRFKEFLSPQDVLQEAVLLASSMKNLLHGAWRCTACCGSCDLMAKIQTQKIVLKGKSTGKYGVSEFPLKYEV